MKYLNMNGNTRTPLKANLADAVIGVLADSKARITGKIEKEIRRSVKRIARLTDKQLKKSFKKMNHEN